MKVLHTSDWHVGKVLKGQHRHEEHAAVLAEIVEVARAEQPDLVLVAGDLFDSAAPAPGATRLVTGALSALRGTGAEVVAIAGNHDNGPALDALRPWAEAAGITLRGTVRTPDEHLLTGVTAGGEQWRLVALPFVSQRYAVRATELFDLSAAEATQTYADHLARMIDALTREFAPDAVNLVTTHLTVVGGRTGGGEREAHTIQAYAVPATIFPASAHYVALGHLHREQQVPGAAPVRYCGSPLAIDFGEGDNTPGLSVVEVAAQSTARARHVPLTSAVPLRTVHGTLDELTAATNNADQGEGGGERRSNHPSKSLISEEAWLRVYVRERPRAGLREQVQELLPRALEVRIDPDMMPEAEAENRPNTRAGRTPGELFAEYLDARGHADDQVKALFEELYGEATGADATPATAG